MKQPYFVARKKWKQMLKKHGEGGKSAFAFIIGIKLADGMLGENQDISRNNPLRRVRKCVLGNATLDEDKRKFILILGLISPQF